MVKFWKPLHTHGAKVIVALVVAIIAVFPAAGQAQRAWAKDVRVTVVNNSSHVITVKYCAMGDLSTAYDYGLQHDPCHKYTREVNINPGGDRQYFEANPLGFVISGNGKYFYAVASNPTVGKPYIALNGSKTHFVEGELQSRNAGGISVRLHRPGDTQALKMMIIEVLKT